MATYFRSPFAQEHRAETPVHLSTPPHVSQTLCPYCGGKNAPGALFCGVCGQAMHPNVSAPSTLLLDGQTLVLSTPPHGDLVFCPHCGTENARDALFCGECGRIMHPDSPNFAPLPLDNKALIVDTPGLDMLYREGMLLQAQGDLEEAFSRWQRVLDSDPNYQDGTLAFQINKLFNKLIPERLSKVRLASRSGAWEDEIHLWEKILAFKRDEKNTVARMYQKLARQRIIVARQNGQHAWLYKDAKAFIKAGKKQAARALLKDLWEQAPHYGDPDKLARKGGFFFPLALNTKRKTIWIRLILLEGLFLGLGGMGLAVWNIAFIVCGLGAVLLNGLIMTLLSDRWFPRQL